MLKKLRKAYCLRLGICPSCMKVGRLNSNLAETGQTHAGLQQLREYPASA
jgi:hypothetical protein